MVIVETQFGSEIAYCASMMLFFFLRALRIVQVMILYKIKIVNIILTYHTRGTLYLCCEPFNFNRVQCCCYYCLLRKMGKAMIAPKFSNYRLLSTLCTQFRYLIGTYYLILGYSDINCILWYFCRKSLIRTGSCLFFLPNIHGILVGPSAMVWQHNIGPLSHIVVWAATLGESAI